MLLKLIRSIFSVFFVIFIINSAISTQWRNEHTAIDLHHLLWYTYYNYIQHSRDLHACVFNFFIGNCVWQGWNDAVISICILQAQLEVILWPRGLLALHQYKYIYINHLKLLFNSFSGRLLKYIFSMHHVYIMLRYSQPQPNSLSACLALLQFFLQFYCLLKNSLR